MIKGIMTHRQIYGSANAPQVPPKPRPTHLPVILAARCTIPHTLLCHILYCAAYCTGQPPTLVTQRNRAQTAPPDCSQTRLKSDQKTAPTSDRPSLPSTAPPHHSVTKMYIFEYIRILSDSSTHSYFIRFKNLNIFIRTLFVSNFRRNNISCFKAAYK